MKKEIFEKVYEELKNKGLYKAFSLRPDNKDGKVEMYEMNNKSYDVYLDNENKVEKIIEWGVK